MYSTTIILEYMLQYMFSPLPFYFRLRRQQQNPGLFGKMRSARYSPEDPDGPASDVDEEDKEVQLQIP